VKLSGQHFSVISNTPLNGFLKKQLQAALLKAQRKSCLRMKLSNQSRLLQASEEELKRNIEMKGKARRTQNEGGTGA
jgi:hypothetical protein